MTGSGTGLDREAGDSRAEKFVAALAGGGAYAERVREIVSASQAGGLPAAFDDNGRFQGLQVGEDAQLPPGWIHDGGLAVPDRAVAAGRWVSDAIAWLEKQGTAGEAQ